MEVRRDIIIETVTTLQAAADRLELIEFHGNSAGIVSACRLLVRTLTLASDAAPRIEATREKPAIVITREALRAVLREELEAAIPPRVREIVAAVTVLLAEQAMDGPPGAESPPPVAQGVGDGRA
jgi:hypothetical protein